MKTRIDNLLRKQLNFILDFGQHDLLPTEYLVFILDNYEFLSSLNSDELDSTDKHIMNSLSVLVSKLK